MLVIPLACSEFKIHNRLWSFQILGWEPTAYSLAPANKYMLKINNRNIRNVAMFEVTNKDTRTTSVTLMSLNLSTSLFLTLNHTKRLLLMFLLLILNRYIFAGYLALA